MKRGVNLSTTGWKLCVEFQSGVKQSKTTPKHFVEHLGPLPFHFGIISPSSPLCVCCVLCVFVRQTKDSDKDITPKLFILKLKAILL
ncbi:hypothetical protein Csa_003507 [Cucumis sativus]|uniref:Uncharacterized protein n=1 Tax=Cucumis sativus TaxID=3659 RepID=A0A0A0KLE1_CUCSA|nr:hypothetical protein Csa_003507 [Cucumis sativus]